MTLGPVLPHPDPEAVALGVTRVRGHDIVVRKAEWKEGDRAVFVEPDYVLPDALLPATMRGKGRVRPMKLRGQWSMGLLLPLAGLPLPEDVPEGADVMEALGITRHQPPEDAGGDNVVGPACARDVPAYGLESWRLHGERLLRPDDIVVVTEKINGETGRYACEDGRMHVGSRIAWKDPAGSSPWAQALRDNPWVETWCRENPGAVLYGEVFGADPRMRYGVAKGHRGFRAFDLLKGGLWMPWGLLLRDVGIARLVPVFHVGPLSEVSVEDMAEGVSVLAEHLREGVVVRLRGHDVGDDTRGGDRVILKCVGNGFLSRHG